MTLLGTDSSKVLLEMPPITENTKNFIRLELSLSLTHTHTPLGGFVSVIQ